MLVFIVDESAKGLASDLNSISQREKQEIEFQALLTPEQLFQALESDHPDLILLHHHWPGLSIGQLLERISTGAETRVIVFTGQAINVVELIDCVRSGVADYWTRRGRLDPIVVFRKIAYYCSSPDWTVCRLRVASGSQEQLIREAENSVERINGLVQTNSKLTERLRVLEDSQRSELWQFVRTCIRFIVIVSVLTLAFVAVNLYTSLPVWVALAFVGILALFFLFLEDKIAEALIKWKGGSAQIKVKRTAA